MWESLPIDEKQEYQKMILAFASLSEVFAQKSEDVKKIAPIINSKYQEAVFQKAFHAVVEDIGNTSYDASINIKETGQKYLIGIKTFGFNSGSQKVAQFKKDSILFTDLYSQIVDNAKNDNGTWKSADEINEINHNLYQKIAAEVSEMRNKRIRSSKENLKGFDIGPNDTDIESVYHVLMPFMIDGKPVIYVGEAAYDEINIDNIVVKGCTSRSHPKNFIFEDGNHEYKYTESDSQLLMNFQTKDIICDSWYVHYVEDAYAVFAKIADGLNAAPDITEEYKFPLWNDNGMPEMFSGLNQFNGSPKSSKGQREKQIAKLREKYKDIIDKEPFKWCLDTAQDVLLNSKEKHYSPETKAEKRDAVFQKAEESGNNEFAEEIKNIMRRPAYEVYIPIHNAKEFHKNHPDFFAKNAGELKPGTNKLKLSIPERSFDLVFEPSGQMIRSYINQDTGKAIESCEKQTILGKWILKGIFQLKEYEPLTREKMEEVGINAIRLYRTNKDNAVHLEFIWVDENPLHK